MKQLWATDPEKIEKELSQIINNKIPLSCFKAGSKEIRKVWASGLSKKKRDRSARSLPRSRTKLFKENVHVFLPSSWEFH
jgi:hypothetical protein